VGESLGPAKQSVRSCNDLDVEVVVILML
jgi:hypothetical protein